MVDISGLLGGCGGRWAAGPGETSASSRPGRGTRACPRRSRREPHPSNQSGDARVVAQRVERRVLLAEEQIALALLEGPVERRERAVALAEPREDVGEPGLGAPHGTGDDRRASEGELGLPVTAGPAGPVGLQEPLGELWPQAGLVLDRLGEAAQPFLDAGLH